jgi:hypothetical protein
VLENAASDGRVFRSHSVIADVRPFKLHFNPHFPLGVALMNFEMLVLAQHPAQNNAVNESRR